VYRVVVKKGLETRSLLIISARESVPLSGTSKPGSYYSESGVSKCIWTREYPGHRFSVKKSEGKLHCCILWGNGLEAQWIE